MFSIREMLGITAGCLLYLLAFTLGIIILGYIVTLLEPNKDEVGNSLATFALIIAVVAAVTASNSNRR